MCGSGGSTNEELGKGLFRSVNSRSCPAHHHHHGESWPSLRILLMHPPRASSSMFRPSKALLFVRAARNAVGAWSAVPGLP
jgi:hypothetical protein